MTPKEKAKFLIYRIYFDVDLYSVVMPTTKIILAKQCAKITVNEIIENNYNTLDSMKYHEELNFWQAVKDELEDLNYK